MERYNYNGKEIIGIDQGFGNTWSFALAFVPMTQSRP